MTDDEYRNLIATWRAGNVLIGIDRATARQFYTDASLHKIAEETGYAPYLQKFVVRSAFFTSYLALIGSFVLSVLAFGWYATLIIPGSFFVYFVFTFLSSQPNRGMILISFLLGLSVLGLFMSLGISPVSSWYFSVYLLALWCSRFLYCASTTFLRMFVIRNKKAFELLGDHVEIRYKNF